MRDRKYGLADIHLNNGKAVLPYRITAYTHNGKEVVLVDESGNPRIWNDTVWMAVCMRSVWHPDGAGQLCVYAENQPEYMDCLICSTVDSL